MDDPFQTDPLTAPLGVLAIPKGRHVGSSGFPLFRVTFADASGKHSIRLTESATSTSARAWAQRICAGQALTVVSVGRWLGGPIPEAGVSRSESSNLLAFHEARVRLACALRCDV